MRWLDELVTFANENLGERELEALWTRGVTDEQIQSFQIGYLRSLPVAQELPKDFSSWWSGKKLEDVFVFPLTNALGQVKGLQFRHVRREVKGYQDYFLVKDEPIYFGLAQAMPHVWATRTVCLVEGVFDFFPVQRVLPNTVPTMTASVTSSFLRFLKRNVREIWFCYDMDAAGRDGTHTFIKEHGSKFDRIKAPQLPRLKFADGKLTKDPSDVWELLGDERLGVYLKSAFER